MNPRLAARSIVALGFAASTACIGLDFDGPAIDGSGRIASETRTVQEFDRITIGGAFDVEVTAGPAVSVTLTGDDNLLPLVGTEVRGATLHVEPERDLDPTDDIHVRITTPRLRGLSTSGSSEVRATGIRSPAFEAQVSGSSELAADGDFGDIDASISGSGEIHMRGTGDRIEASVSGSGELDLAEVVARTADVHVSGSGEAAVHVVESLDASVSGSGDIRYLGNPRVRSNVSGSGSVQPVSASR